MFYIARSLTDKNEFLTSVMWSLGFSFFFFEASCHSCSSLHRQFFPAWGLAVCRLADSEPSSSYFSLFFRLLRLLFFSKSFFLSYQVFFFLPSPSPLSLRSAAGLYLTGNIPADVAAVVDLTPWQTPSIGMICIHKSIGYLTLANTPGQRGAAVLSRPGHIIIGDGGLMKCDSAAAATATAADWLTHSPPCPL